jgi:2-polyprenyl-6-methoxyphenol hydroxylase-like FAD-dependent oxidoreductase
LTPYQATIIQQDSASSRVRLVHRELVTLGSPAHYSDWEPVASSIVQADFVLGADGYDSRVRSALGIEAARVGELETFAMFEVSNDVSPFIQLAFQDGLASAAVPLPGGKTRLAFQIDSRLDVEANAARLRELLARAPWLSLELGELEWSSVIHFERRLCRSFGAGRTWLAGDSAHVTSPLGAQSMNLGLYEAFDFVQKVVACSAGQGRLDLLQQYGAERQREWHKLLGFHVKYELLPGAPAWLGAHARRIGSVLPASGAELKLLLRQLGLLIT